MTITDAIHQAVLQISASAWTAAVEPDGEIRDGAWVAEIDAGSDCLTGWPKGIRLIVRKPEQAENGPSASWDPHARSWAMSLSGLHREGVRAAATAEVQTDRRRRRAQYGGCAPGDPEVAT